MSPCLTLASCRDSAVRPDSQSPSHGEDRVAECSEQKQLCGISRRRCPTGSSVPTASVSDVHPLPRAALFHPVPSLPGTWHCAGGHVWESLESRELALGVRRGRDRPLKFGFQGGCGEERTLPGHPHLRRAGNSTCLPCSKLSRIHHGQDSAF